MHAQDASSPSDAYRLAAAQVGGPIQDDDPLIQDIGVALTTLGEKCLEPSDQLAGLTIHVHDRLLQYGTLESNLEILRSMSDFIPDEVLAQSRAACSDVFGMYFISRVSASRQAPNQEPSN